MKPSKSISATWSIRVLVRPSRVRTASAGPPNAYAALILFRPCPGMLTYMSRGKEMM